MHTKAQQYFLLLLIAVMGIIVFYILQPFLSVLALAAVAAVVFYPIYQYFLKLTKEKKSLASFTTIFLTAVVIILPVVLVGMQLVKEASALYGSMVVSGGAGTFTAWFSGLSANFSGYFPNINTATIDIAGYFEQGLSMLLQNALPIFSNLAHLLLNAFIFLVALYFLLRDGDVIVKSIVKLSPLYDKDDRNILASLGQAVNSVVTGSLLIALIQGFVATIGFAIFGVPHSILFGSIAAIAALLPGVGTALVLIPAILYLFAVNSTSAAIGLIIWGAIAVGLVDNFLGPKMMGRGVRLPSLLMFLSVIGGISLFGPFGFIFGPLAMSLLFSLVEFFFGEKLV